MEKNNITYEMVIEKNKHIKEGSEEIWTFVLKLMEKAVEKGYIKNSEVRPNCI